MNVVKYPSAPVLLPPAMPGCEAPSIGALLAEARQRAAAARLGGDEALARRWDERGARAGRLARVESGLQA